MREIRFLAWDKLNHKIREVNEIGFINHYIWAKTDTHPLGLSDQQYELMQYTGLKDKNGNEIFEGDIVKITCGCGHQENLPVEWRDGYNGFFAKAHLRHNWDNDQLSLKCTVMDSEVIGNIYQTPGLLEVKK